MKIYSMTATFGKLEHETLTLNPGLNVIEAPNEWGKSTWCAFLVNMLYGLDTRAKTTKNILADKDRYAPWSGSPMAGRIDLNWNGRDITIERRTRGRLVFGEFLAYETATGLEIPELNGTNCGSMLLGVERSVFTRAGFLKLTDLPVTQDEALRRRLNSLVTTGDESGAGDKLQQALKDLKNKCRYNRSGLLPQAEAQREHLTNQISELSDLQQQSEILRQRQKELEDRIDLLENHRAALRYEAARLDAEKVAQAQHAQHEAQLIFDGLQANCDGLPSRQEAEKAIQLGNSLQQQYHSLQMEAQMLPPLPDQPERPSYLADVTPEDAEAAAQADLDALKALEAKKRRKNTVSYAVTGLCVLSLIALALAWFVWRIDMPMLFLAAGIGVLAIMVGTVIYSVVFTSRWRGQVEALCDRHPGRNAGLWLSDAADFAAAFRAYEKAFAEATALRGDLDERQSSVAAEISVFAKDGTLSERIDAWRQTIAAWNALADATRELRRCESHVQALQSMAHTAEPPRFPDTLTHTESETDAFLQTARFELRQLQLKLGQYQGRSEALGQETVLRTQLRSVNQRITRLEDTYAALELAQKALSAATAELQRRFAPRISKRAQELFGKLTGGRYDRLTLSEDLSLNTSAQTEDTLRSSQWRSDGTVDQLYLALRLAVAEELTPNAPLILDDALVRFDEARLAAAMDILQETAQNKQVILFTCQARENRHLEDAL